MDRRLVQPSSASFLVRVSLPGELRASSRGKARGMIMNAKPLQRGICGDTNARGRARSRLLELYTQSKFRRAEEKIHPELLPPAAADCAWGVRLIDRGSKKEDEKLSTEAGQVHFECILSDDCSLPHFAVVCGKC